MEVNKFELELEKLNLSKKEFAELTDLPYQTIMNWKRSDSIPKWVKSWLENYIEMRKHEALKKTLRDSGVCDID